MAVPSNAALALCALFLVLWFERLQNAFLPERAYALEIKTVNLMFPKHIVVVQPPIEPETKSVPTYRPDFNVCRGRDGTIVIGLRWLGRPYHILPKIFYGENEGQSIGKLGCNQRLDNKFFDYSWRFSIILEVILDREVFTTSERPAALDVVDHLGKIMFIDYNEKSGAFGGDSSVGGFLGADSGDSGRFCETNRKDSENSREYRDDDSGCSGDNGILVGDISANATSVQWDHSPETGDAVFKVLFGWFNLSAGFDALLKVQ
jgi:hypothetical protein